MNKAYETLIRLGQRVSKDDHVLCLLGLGSMSETKRMDEFSDMDFFLIVEKGTKAAYLDDLSWLEVDPIEYAFKNTIDGYKVLFHQGVFAEFAVFEPDELAHIGFTKGNIIYQRSDFDPSLVEPRCAPKKETLNVDYCLNEALTNIYIGVLRHQRGETAAALTCIQNYAANNIMKLFEALYQAHASQDDPYAIERRIEMKYQEARHLLKGLKPGYEHNLDAARFALDFLEVNFKPNQALVQTIRNRLK